MSYDQETVHAVLDEAVVCHVGFVVEGRPVVLPHLHARHEEVLYLHGSTGAHLELLQMSSALGTVDGATNDRIRRVEDVCA